MIADVDDSDGLEESRLMLAVFDVLLVEFLFVIVLLFVVIEVCVDICDDVDDVDVDVYVDEGVELDVVVDKDVRGDVDIDDVEIDSTAFDISLVNDDV